MRGDGKGKKEEEMRDNWRERENGDVWLWECESKKLTQRQRRILPLPLL